MKSLRFFIKEGKDIVAIYSLKSEAFIIGTIGIKASDLNCLSCYSIICNGKMRNRVKLCGLTSLNQDYVMNSVNRFGLLDYSSLYITRYMKSMKEIE